MTAPGVDEQLMKRNLPKITAAIALPTLLHLACGFDGLIGSDPDAVGDDGGDEAATGGESSDDAEREASEDDNVVEAAQLSLLLTDAPADVEAVFVTFGEVQVQACDGADEDEHGDDTGEPPEDEHGDDTGELPEDEPSEADEAPGAPGEPAEGTDDEDEADEEDEADDEDDSEDDDSEDDEAEDDDSEDEAEDDSEDEAEGCENGHWMTISEETVTFDLLTLQGGVTAGLGLANLPSGEYGQIRLFIEGASVVVAGEELPVTIPPGKLMLNGGFELVDGMRTELTIDFDADRSLHYAPGNGWMLKPVIAIVSETTAPIPDDEAGTGGSEGVDTGEAGGTTGELESTTGEAEPMPL